MRTDTTNIAEIDAFDEVIDVRSPAEFALDHIPGAINLPALDDAERAIVGTIYKQESPFRAKKVGAAMVARNIARHLDTALADRDRNWRPLIYCWRGGKRSGSMTTVLRGIGWDARQLDGGYKAYRRVVVTDTDAIVKQLSFAVVCGLTGSGKSRLLNTLASRGSQVLDLEQLALHRGSVLGKVPETPQPTQKMFESRLWQRLRKFDSRRPVFVESESKRIGTLRLPESLVLQMWESDCIRVDTDAPTRVRLLTQDYEHFLRDAQALREPLQALIPLHGHGRVAEWLTLIDNAQFEPLVMQLLAQHYDPAYLRSISTHYSRFHSARVIRIDDLDSNTFDTAAQQLLAEMRAAA